MKFMSIVAKYAPVVALGGLALVAGGWHVA